MLWDGIRALVWKDLKRELRSLEVVTTTVAFSLLLVVVFSFSFAGSRVSSAELVPGILWTGVLFATVLTINQTFGYERESHCLPLIILMPGGKKALFYAKVLVNTALMLVFESVLFPVLTLVYSLEWGGETAIHFGLLASISAGLAILGTLVSAILSAHRLREILTPLLLFPLAIPLLIAGIYTSHILLGAKTGSLSDWFALILGMDVLFLLVGDFLFERGVS